MLRLVIENQPSLLDTAAALHDARFTREGVCFRPECSVFTLVGTQRIEEDGQMRWKNFELQFRQVFRCDLDFLEEVEYYELATLRLVDASTLEIVTHYACKLVLHLNRVDGTLCLG